MLRFSIEGAASTKEKLIGKAEPFRREGGKLLLSKGSLRWKAATVFISNDERLNCFIRTN